MRFLYRTNIGIFCFGSNLHVIPNIDIKVKISVAKSSYAYNLFLIINQTAFFGKIYFLSKIENSLEGLQFIILLSDNSYKTLILISENSFFIIDYKHELNIMYLL